MVRKKKSYTKPDHVVTYSQIDTWREIPRFKCDVCGEISLGLHAAERHAQKHEFGLVRKNKDACIRYDRYGVEVKGE